MDWGIAKGGPVHPNSGDLGRSQARQNKFVVS